jgi:hypothetical protein
VSSSNRGPGYTINDLVYWGGLIGGVVVTHLALMPVEMHNLARLVISLVVGVGVGYLCEKAYDKSKGRRGPPPD